ncbi:sensor histidine kinase [Propionicicella superfundia]|uniref:sensor histidine kinase n=1 Tax=Propionicicella superfundia TaxID=348582 RepID=UPI000416448D|nr:ATP-binding protein [Propionicicella superfundia]
MAQSPLMDRSDLATRAFDVSVNRALALYAVVAGIAVVGVGFGEPASVDGPWLGVVALLLVACTLGMVLSTARPQAAPVIQALYAATVFAALSTWQVAWHGSASSVRPFLWPVIGIAVIALAWAGRETWVTMVVTPAAALAWGFLRLDQSGGAVGVLLATQESLVLLAQAVGWSLALGVGHRAAEQLDASTDRAAAIAEQTAIRASMRREQRILDALLHDRVMTTLAAAGRGTISTDRIAEMAAGARDALRSYDNGDPAEQLTGPETVELITRLVADASVNATVHVTCEPGVSVPHHVGLALARAAQEGVRNAVRHASAAHIAVTGVVGGDERTVEVRLTVSDDGVGFDPSEVPERRLGVRLAVQERMNSVGGSAVVTSRPGEGTTVRLTWTGDVDGTAREIPSDIAGTLGAQVDVDGLVWIGRLQTGFMMALGVADAAVAGRTGEWLTLLLMSAAGVLAFGPRVRARLRVGETSAIAVLLAGASALQGASGGGWNASSILLAVVILFAVRARGTSRGSWSVLALLSAAGVLATLWTGSSLIAHLISLAALFVGLLLADNLLRWLALVGVKVKQSRAEFEEATSRAAGLFSALLRRDVWMAGVRASVEPMLKRLSDTSVPLSESERAHCLRLEARLRDSITARNLAAPLVAQAVESARERGVSVTLIDNRQGALPEPAREAAHRRLAAAADASSEGRIVARVAPEGYRDLVTIMTDTDGGHTLISIDQEGQVTQT